MAVGAKDFTPARVIFSEYVEAKKDTTVLFAKPLDSPTDYYRSWTTWAEVPESRLTLTRADVSGVEALTKLLTKRIKYSFDGMSETYVGYTRLLKNGVVIKEWTIEVDVWKTYSWEGEATSGDEFWLEFRAGVEHYANHCKNRIFTIEGTFDKNPSELPDFYTDKIFVAAGGRIKINMASVFEYATDTTISLTDYIRVKRFDYTTGCIVYLYKLKEIE